MTSKTPNVTSCITTCFCLAVSKHGSRKARACMIFHRTLSCLAPDMWYAQPSARQQNCLVKPTYTYANSIYRDTFLRICTQSSKQLRQLHIKDQFIFTYQEGSRQRVHVNMTGSTYCTNITKSSTCPIRRQKQCAVFLEDRRHKGTITAWVEVRAESLTLSISFRYDVGAYQN